MHTRIFMGMALSDFPLFVGFELPHFLLLFLLLSRHETSFILVLVSIPTIAVHSFTQHTHIHPSLLLSIPVRLYFAFRLELSQLYRITCTCLLSFLCLRCSPFPGLFQYCQQ